MISKVSFGSNAYTDKGNTYNKTSLGKKIGAAGLCGASLVLSAAQGGFKKENISLAAELLGGKGKYAAYSVAGLAITAAIGLGLGAIVDAVINKVRKNKADKAAMPQQNMMETALNTTQGRS